MCSNAAACRFDHLADGWLVGRLSHLAELPGITHAVSTRTGPRGASFRADHPFGPANRQALVAAIGAERFVTVHQVHGNDIATADEAMAASVQADGLMTDRPGVAVLGLSADCPIVLVADPATGAVAMAHASWRSTVGRVTARLIAAMQNAYGCDPATMHAGVCPSAGPCCYEVGADVIEAVDRSLGAAGRRCVIGRDGRTYFDLWAANVAQLTEAGLAGRNIEVAGVCSICDNRFFSYRREGERAGRYGGMIARI